MLEGFWLYKLSKISQWIFKDIKKIYNLIFLCLGYGNCLFRETFGKLPEGQFVKVSLNTTLKYRIWLHDPKFFLVSMNPSSTPSLSINIEKGMLKMLTIGAEVAMQFLVAEKITLYNRDNSPCTHYEDFNSYFHACVIGKTTSKIGCKVITFPQLNMYIK